MTIGSRKERSVRENGESDETGESVMEQEKREQDAYSILSDHVNAELTEKKIGVSYGCLSCPQRRGGGREDSGSLQEILRCEAPLFCLCVGGP